MLQLRQASSSLSSSSSFAVPSITAVQQGSTTTTMTSSCTTISEDDKEREQEECEQQEEKQQEEKNNDDDKVFAQLVKDDKAIRPSTVDNNDTITLNDEPVVIIDQEYRKTKDAVTHVSDGDPEDEVRMMTMKKKETHKETLREDELVPTTPNLNNNNNQQEPEQNEGVTSNNINNNLQEQPLDGTTATEAMDSSRCLDANLVSAYNKEEDDDDEKEQVCDPSVLSSLSSSFSSEQSMKSPLNGATSSPSLLLLSSLSSPTNNQSYRRRNLVTKTATRSASFGTTTPTTHKNNNHNKPLGTHDHSGGPTTSPVMVSGSVTISPSPISSPTMALAQHHRQRWRRTLTPTTYTVTSSPPSSKRRPQRVTKHISPRQQHQHEAESPISSSSSSSSSYTPQPKQKCSSALGDGMSPEQETILARTRVLRQRLLEEGTKVPAAFQRKDKENGVNGSTVTTNTSRNHSHRGRSAQTTRKPVSSNHPQTRTTTNTRLVKALTVPQGPILFTERRVVDRNRHLQYTRRSLSPPKPIRRSTKPLTVPKGPNLRLTAKYGDKTTTTTIPAATRMEAPRRRRGESSSLSPCQKLQHLARGNGVPTLRSSALSSSIQRRTRGIAGLSMLHSTASLNNHKEPPSPASHQDDTTLNSFHPARKTRRKQQRRCSIVRPSLAMTSTLTAIQQDCDVLACIQEDEHEMNETSHCRNNKEYTTTTPFVCTTTTTTIHSSSNGRMTAAVTPS